METGNAEITKPKSADKNQEMEAAKPKPASEERDSSKSSQESESKDPKTDRVVGCMEKDTRQAIADAGHTDEKDVRKLLNALPTEEAFKVPFTSMGSNKDSQVTEPDSDKPPNVESKPEPPMPEESSPIRVDENGRRMCSIELNARQAIADWGYTDEKDVKRLLNVLPTEESFKVPFVWRGCNKVSQETESDSDKPANVESKPEALVPVDANESPVSSIECEGKQKIAEREHTDPENVSGLTTVVSGEDTFKVPYSSLKDKSFHKRKLPDPPRKQAKNPTTDSDEPVIVLESIEPPKAPQDQKQLPLPYKEPAWGGNPSEGYKVEVLKSGVILDTIDLTKKSFHVIGRLPVCDIPLAHPTISRYHAILQYRSEGDEKNEAGFYLYDLESTHGSFWNSCRIRPKTYVKLKGGHMLRFGCSQRKFIIQTPPEDEEQESEYSVTQLKEIRRQELMAREKEQQMEEETERLRKEKEEAEGINWGMGEDADEETDLTENPYAMSNNEELFLDDPKKTLRGWFEREGFDLQYQTEEKGIGQFLCWVDLPVDPSGRTVRAEALVKGKKKESVIQCALEACRVLDRHGLLRQATHEARKRKSRNWEEEDYYDSDEDNFLDRTGTVERKREKRMRNAGKLEDKAENFTTLTGRLAKVAKDIEEIEHKLKKYEEAKAAGNSDSNEDALDAYMSSLNTSMLSKSEVLKLKSTLQKLKKDEENYKKLVEITRPTSFPSLITPMHVDEAQEHDRSLVKGDSVSKVVEKEEKKVNRYGLIRSEDIAASEAMIHVKKTVRGDEEKEVEESEDTATAMGTVEEKVKESKEVEQKKELSEAEIARRKKKNMKRTQRRAEKAAEDSHKSFDEDIYKEDYSTWVPPSNQTGDGRTSLNDKFGY